MNTIKIISVILGTVIGAGLASGKEIYVFFAQFGKAGIIGAIISSALTAIIIYCTILISQKRKIKNNNQFIKELMPNHKILEKIINAFLIISFWIMCAGFSTFFKQEFNIPIIITAIINAILLYIMITQNIKGIMKLNVIIVPIMLAIIVIITIRNCMYIKIQYIEPKNLIQAIVNAILYTSYNSIMLIPTIIALSSEIKKPKMVSIISGIIIFALIITIDQMLIISPINVSNADMPMLRILDQYNLAEKNIYSIAIVAAIITSAISAGRGILENITEKTKQKGVALCTCTLSIPISYIGFGRLVEILYPTFGIIGIFQLVIILNTIAKNAEN